MNHDERSMSQRNTAIIDGWVRLYICITTNDINEFYKALSGKLPRKGVKKNYTWETANKPYERKKRNKISRKNEVRTWNE